MRRKLRGNGYSLAENRAEAAKAYASSLNYIDKGTDPLLWADIESNRTHASLMELIDMGEEQVLMNPESLKQKQEEFEEILHVVGENGTPMDRMIAYYGQTATALFLSLRETDSIRQEQALCKALQNAEEATTNAAKIVEKPEAWGMARQMESMILSQLSFAVPREQSRAIAQRAEAAIFDTVSVRALRAYPDQWLYANKILGEMVVKQNWGRTDPAALRSFERAIESLGLVLANTDRAEEPDMWARAHADLAHALERVASGNSVATPQVQQDLADSIESSQLALTYFTRQTNPAIWAELHNQKGLALEQLAIRFPSNDAAVQLKEAADDFSRTLEIWTPSSDPSGNQAATKNMNRVRERLSILKQHGNR